MKNIESLLKSHFSKLKTFLLYLNSLAKWMVPQQPRPEVSWLQSGRNYMRKKFSAKHFQNQKQLVFFLAAILIVNSALFIARAYYFRGFSNLDGSMPNPFYMLSRANGTYLSCQVFVDPLIWRIL
jgi:hypothetical protein